MSRGNKFVLRREDKQKLSKEVSKFNAKLTRTLKKNPELAPYLPERKTVLGERSKISNRNEFNSTVKSIERFMKKGAETPIESNQGIKTTKWEKKEVQLKFNKKEKIKAKQLTDANLTSEKGTMGSAKKNNLLPSKYEFETKPAKDWKAFKENLDKFLSPTANDEAMKLYRANFHKAVDANQQGASAKQLHKMIDALTDEQLVNAQYDNPLLTIDYQYDPHEQQEVYDNSYNEFLNYFEELTGLDPLEFDETLVNPFYDEDDE